MKGKFVYANGLNIGQARRVFKYAFADFFIKADKNDKQLRFDVYVKDKIKVEDKVAFLKDWIDLDYFNEYWNDQGEIGAPKKDGVFNVIIMTEKEHG